MRALLLVSLLALAIPALCSEPVVRERRSATGGVEYFKLYTVNLNQAYSLVANASLDGSSWDLAKPAWAFTVHKETVSSSPLQGNALNIIVDPSCSSSVHSQINFGVSLTNNESMGTFTDFYTNSYTYPCPIGSWVYDPQHVVASVYFYITVDTPQVPICPFTLKYGTGPSPDSNCPSSSPQYPGGPAPNTGNSGGGLSTGAIAGIAIGCCCAVVLVFALIVLARRRNASTSEYTQPLTQQPHETGYQTGETEHRHSGPHHDTTGHTFA